MTSITQKLDDYLSLGINTLNEADFIALFGADYKSLLIEENIPTWQFLIFKEEKKMYSVYIQVVEQKFETFTLMKEEHQKRYYEEVDEDMFTMLKEKATLYEEELEKITKILTHKKVRLKGLF